MGEAIPDAKKSRCPETAGSENLWVGENLAGLAHLFNDAGNGAAGLGPNSEPFVGFFEVEGVIFTFSHGVISAELLDVTTVATNATVNGYDFVVRTVLRTLASETKCYHSFGGGGRNLVGERSFAKVFLPKSGECGTFLAISGNWLGRLTSIRLVKRC